MRPALRPRPYSCVGASSRRHKDLLPAYRGRRFPAPRPGGPHVPHRTAGRDAYTLLDGGLKPVCWTKNQAGNQLIFCLIYLLLQFILRKCKFCGFLTAVNGGFADDVVHGDLFGTGNAGKAVAEAVKGQRRKMVLRDEARKEFRSVVGTHRPSVLICKDAAAVPIGIFQKSTAILIQSVSRLRCFLFA